MDENSKRSAIHGIDFMPQAELGAVNLRKNGAMPPGDWRRVSPCLQVAGAHHRKQEGAMFARTAAESDLRGCPFGLAIEREPSNKFDPNALKIMGWVNGQRWHLGYVERSFAAYCADRFADAEFAAELHNVYCSPSDNDYFPPSSYVSVFYFICVAQNTPHRIGLGFQKVLLELADELTFVCFAAGTGSRIEWEARQYIWKYVVERASDLKFQVSLEDRSDFWTWIKESRPLLNDVATATHRLVEQKSKPKVELRELAQIFVGLSGNSIDQRGFKIRQIEDLFQRGT